MRRCLVIEDSALIRKIARMVLERMRFEVEEAETAEDALNRCKKVMPDFILLDWNLPGSMTSMEFLAGLRPILRNSKPYIIYCTTENDPMDISRACHAGCDDVMLKPFTRADLEAKLGTQTVAA